MKRLYSVEVWVVTRKGKKWKLIEACDALYKAQSYVLEFKDRPVRIRAWKPV